MQARVQSWKSCESGADISPSHGHQWPVFRSAFAKCLMAFALGGLVAVPFPSAAQSLCGDCDLDGVISVSDLARVAEAIVGAATNCLVADSNGDLVVSLEDLVSVVPGSGLVCSLPPTPTATATASTTPSATPTPMVDRQNPPTDSQALKRWLEDRNYLGWHAESALHRSGGPHGGMVRTFLNDVVFDSLTAGNAQHPKGAAVVKELYFGSSTVQEWAVEIKLEDTSANGANWYWYEGLGLAGRGLGICTGCHGGPYRGFISKDYVLTPFPLQ